MTEQIAIHKASPFHDQKVSSAQITIDAELPSFTTLGAQDNLCDAEAAELEEALWKSLPGATYNRLLVMMLTRETGHLRVTNA